MPNSPVHTLTDNHRQDISVIMAHGLAPDVPTYTEAASQSFKIGDFVGLSSGKVRQNISNGSKWDSSGDLVVGLARQPASGTTDANVDILVADGLTRYSIPVYHATPASAVTAVSQKGTTVQLYYSTAAGFFASIADTSSGIFLIEDIDPRLPVGTSYGYVIGRFISGERAIA